MVVVVLAETVCKPVGRLVATSILSVTTFQTVS